MGKIAMTDIIFWNTSNQDEFITVPNRYIGPHRLNQWLNSHGHNSRVIDFCSFMNTDDLVKVTESLITPRTIAIGVSTTFWYNWRKAVGDIKSGDKDELLEKTSFEPLWVIRAREIIQERYPQIIWILGGAGVTDWVSYGNRKERFNWMKFVGHSEDNLLKFLDEKTNKKSYFPRINFNICTAQNVYDTHNYIQSSEVLPLDMARGCQFKCKFCRYPLLGKQKNTYIRDYTLVEQEVRENYERFGTTRYVIIDDTVNETDEKIIALANMAQKLPFKFEWVGYNRLDLIGTRPHTIQILRDSGLRSTFFGIESFKASSSKMIGKGWIGKNGRDFLVKLISAWQSEISVQLGLIVGLGDESRSELEETEKFCRENVFGSWHYFPLSILSRNSLTEFPSTFDLEHEKYGYTFPNSKRPHSWVSNSWTWEKALSVANQLNAQKSTKVFAGFNLSSTASAGYDFKDLMNINMSQVNNLGKKEKISIMLNNYISDMLNS